MTVSVFSPQQLDEIISRTIPNDLPAGHRNAVVANVDLTGVHVAALMQIDKAGHWRIKAAGEYDWNGDRKAGISILDSW